MTQPIIAIDIDDVLAKSTEALRVTVNKRFHVNLSPEDYKVRGVYWQYYEDIWKQHGLEGKIKLADLEPMMEVNQEHVYPYDDALGVLRELKQRYKLIVVTSRPPSWQALTEDWLSRHFPKVFDEVLFTRIEEGTPHATKGKICTDRGVSWLIDDNVEHAQSARDENIEVILFGEYGWQHEAPSHFHRCRTWKAVKEYFDARS